MASTFHPLDLVSDTAEGADVKTSLHRLAYQLHKDANAFLDDVGEDGNMSFQERSIVKLLQSPYPLRAFEALHFNGHRNLNVPEDLGATPGERVTNILHVIHDAADSQGLLDLVNDLDASVHPDGHRQTDIAASAFTPVHIGPDNSNFIDIQPLDGDCRAPGYSDQDLELLKARDLEAQNYLENGTVGYGAGLRANLTVGGGIGGQFEVVRNPYEGRTGFGFEASVGVGVKGELEGYAIVQHAHGNDAVYQAPSSISGGVGYFAGASAAVKTPVLSVGAGTEYELGVEGDTMAGAKEISDFKHRFSAGPATIEVSDDTTKLEIGVGGSLGLSAGIRGKAGISIADEDVTQFGECMNYTLMSPTGILACTAIAAARPNQYDHLQGVRYEDVVEDTGYDLGL